MIARMSTVLTGPGGTESEWIRMRGEGTVQVFHGKLLDDRGAGMSGWCLQGALTDMERRE